MNGTALGVLLVVVLLGVTVYCAINHILIGVVLAGPPALLFTAAIADNRYFYPRRQTADDAPNDPGQPSGG